MTEGFPFIRAALADAIDPRQREALETFARPTRRDSGSTIYRQDAPAEAVYLIQAGVVELRAQPPGRRRYRTVEISRAGCSFGEEAMLPDGGYLASARVQERADLLVLDRAAIQLMAETRPDLAFEVLRYCCRTLIRSLRRALMLTKAPSPLAIEMVLRELADGSRDGSGEVQLRITHSQLAGMLHLSRESVSRALEEMAAVGTVTLGRGVIHLRT